MVSVVSMISTVSTVSCFFFLSTLWSCSSSCEDKLVSNKGRRLCRGKGFNTLWIFNTVFNPYGSRFYQFTVTSLALEQFGVIPMIVKKPWRIGANASYEHTTYCYYNINKTTQHSVPILWDRLLCRYNAVNFLQNCQKTSHSSLTSARYGMYFLGLNLDLYSASVTAVIYEISCYIGPRFNSTPLYIVYTVFLKLFEIPRFKYKWITMDKGEKRDISEKHEISPHLYQKCTGSISQTIIKSL